MDSVLGIDDMIRAKKLNFLGDEFKTPDGDLAMTKGDIEAVHRETRVHVVGAYSEPLFSFRDLFGDDNNKQRLWDGIMEAHSCYKGYLVHPSDPEVKIRVVTKVAARVCAFIAGDLAAHLTIDNVIDMLYKRRYARVKEMITTTARKLNSDNIDMQGKIRQLECIIRDRTGVPGKSAEMYEAERDELLDKISTRDKIIDLLECEEMSPFVLRMTSNCLQSCDVMSWVLNCWYYHRIINHHADKLYPYCSIKPSDVPYKIRPNFEMMMIGSMRSGWGEHPDFIPDPDKLYLSHEHILQVHKRVSDFVERYGAEAERYVPYDLQTSLLDIDRINRFEIPGTTPLRQKLWRVNLWSYDHDNEVMTGLVRPVFAILDPVYCDECKVSNCKQIVEFNTATGYGNTAKIKIMRISRAIVAELQTANAVRTRQDEKWAESLVAPKTVVK